MAQAITQLRGGSPKKRLGRELRNFYEAAEESPPQLRAVIRKLEAKARCKQKANGAACRGINEVRAATSYSRK
jgi:hypothetical protein